MEVEALALEDEGADAVLEGSVSGGLEGGGGRGFLLGRSRWRGGR